MIKEDILGRVVSNAEIIAEQEEVESCLEQIYEVESEIYKQQCKVEENITETENLKKQIEDVEVELTNLKDE